MSDEAHRAELPPFPGRRPEILIRPSNAEPFGVDCRELRWWFAIPEMGAAGAAAWYDPPDWHLSSIQVSRSMRPARVHETDCVEVAIDEWPAEESSPRGPAEWLMYGRLTDDKVQWLATSRIVDGKRVLYTFLDEGFAEDWGEAPRRMEDRGEFLQQADGCFTWSPTDDSGEGIGAGMFQVAIAGRPFTCLRVLDVGGRAAEDGILVEAYVNSEGRTVLFRRYNGRLWAVGSGGGYDGLPWDERFPNHARAVINGVTFVHWYDCLTHVSCGVAPSARNG